MGQDSLAIVLFDESENLTTQSKGATAVLTFVIITWEMSSRH